jgi:hypothetical protein
MRGQALGNKKYQELRRGNLLTGSVMLLLLLLQRTLYWSCGLFIQFTQRNTFTKRNSQSLCC